MATSDRVGRSVGEWVFLALFYPALLAIYVAYKYPEWLLGPDADPRSFYLFGKNPGFWYNTGYTAFVAGVCIWILSSGKNRYQWTPKKKPLSAYQRWKFTSILAAQLLVFYFLPFVMPGLLQAEGFWHDLARPANKDAHIYVYPGFQSWGMAVYLFLVIPVAVWFFGKRYCSWFCACGNLAETVGLLPWGARWVRLHTPRGKNTDRLEFIQVCVLIFAVLFGAMLLLDGLKLFTAPTWLARFEAFQHLFIDFIFASVVGLGAYPILGTRIWCRFGCPLAAGMRLFGKWMKSPYAVIPSDKCKGLGLCTQVCPMGIDVASFAHKEKKPIQIRFGLGATPCIGCGGCIDVCPVGALSFARVGLVPLAVVSSGPSTSHDGPG